MKVTNRIQEYIEEQVNERMRESAELKAAEKAADEADKAFDAAINDLKARFQTELDKLAKEHNYDSTTPFGQKLEMTIAIRNCYTDKLPARRNYNELYYKMKAKRDKAAKDIIVSLELGGTKEELKEMIANLEF